MTSRLVLVLALAATACQRTTPPPGDDPYREPDDTPDDVDDGGIKIVYEEPDAGQPTVLSIKQVLPARGPAGGGGFIEILGSGFMGNGKRVTDAQQATQVKFGTNPVLDIAVIDDNTLSVKVP